MPTSIRLPDSGRYSLIALRADAKFIIRVWFCELTNVVVLTMFEEMTATKYSKLPNITRDHMTL